MANQKKEIIWNIINSLLAAGLVFLGACSSGEISKQTLIIATVTALSIGVAKFSDYWKQEEGEYRSKKAQMFTFIGG